MKIVTARNWEDYALLDSGDGMRLERYGTIRIARPDPQCIWKPQLPPEQWERADALFAKDAHGTERWVKQPSVPEKWKISYRDLSFWARLTPFKHTGVFPEQSAQWDWFRDILSKANRKTSVLNLFAYTGIASLACAKEGAQVTHLDASRPAIGWARENQTASGLENAPIRWILDDALKFCNRELKRGRKYDGIIMDPPVYGHGPDGERWDFSTHFPELLHICRQLMTEHPLFVLINAYAISSSGIMLENMLNQEYADLKGTIEAGELTLQEEQSNRMLSTGIFARWSNL